MLTTLLIHTVVIFIGAWLFSGVRVDHIFTALGVAVVLGIINFLVKPIIWVLALPLIILTFGLLIPVLNAWILMLISNVIDGFTIKNFWWAFLFGLFISVMNSLLAIFI
jgi:putative membrane protein